MTIVESGAVYSATTVLLLALGAAQNIACYAIIGAATQLAVRPIVTYHGAVTYLTRLGTLPELDRCSSRPWAVPHAER